MQLITRDLIDGLLKKAAASPRLRSTQRFHESPTDPVQRYLIGAKLNS